jgi:hypothetical protein
MKSARKITAAFFEGDRRALEILSGFISPSPRRLPIPV